MMRAAASVWLTPAILTCLMLPCLLGRQRLAFRDVSFFYTPLYEHVDRLSSLRDPLPYWNPADGWTEGTAGMPLAGETSTAVFYPLRWIIYGIFDDAALAMAWYTWLHLVISAMAMHRLASILQTPDRKSPRRVCCRRRMRCNLAAITYSLSGCVLGLYCNTVFLVSAVWIPLAMYLPAAMMRSPVARSGIAGSLWPACVSGAASGLMFLGGDPQTAVHCGMIWVCFALAAIWFQWRPRRLIVGLMLVASVTAILVALPQAAETYAWASQSKRGLLMSSEQRLRFSLPVWHWTECLTPWAWGKLIPVNARLSRLIAGDAPLWTSTVFFGSLGLLTVFSCFTNRRSRRRCLPWMILGLLAGIGAMGDRSLIAVYQSLVSVVPMYDSFRYPPKWLPLVSLSVAAIVAQTALIGPKRFRWQWLVLLSLALLLHLLYCVWLSGHEMNVADEFWGPLNQQLALKVIAGSILVTLTSIWSLIALSRSSRPRRQRDAAIVLICAVEMTWVGNGVLHRVPVKSSTVVQMQAGERFVRISRPDQWPTRWRNTSDPQRLLEIEQTLRHIGFGRWHLLSSAAMVNSMFSVESSKLRNDFETLRLEQSQDPTGDALRRFVANHDSDGLWWEIDPKRTDESARIEPLIERFEPHHFESSPPTRPRWIHWCIVVWMPSFVLATIVLIYVVWPRSFVAAKSGRVELRP